MSKLNKISLFFFVVAMFLCSNIALAGDLNIHDTLQWIPRADINKLSAKASSWPFNVNVLVEDATASALENDAHHAVTGPRVMVIAVDPKHHRVVTRFGNETGVKQGDFDSISKAGNTYFKDGYIYDGLNAIVIRAKASSQAVTAMANSNTPVVIEHQEGLGVGAWVAIILGISMLIGFIIWLARRQQLRDSILEENRKEMSELRVRSSELEERAVERDFNRQLRQSAPVTVRSAPVQSAPVVQQTRPVVVQQPQVVVQPQPIYVQQPPAIYNPYVMAFDVYGNPMIGGRYNRYGQLMYGPGDALIDGMILGMEIAELESLSYHHHHDVIREEVVREEVIVERGSSYDSGGSSSNYSGSSSSNWDNDDDSSSGSSGSSYDSGGSSSSYDGGSSNYDPPSNSGSSSDSDGGSWFGGGDSGSSSSDSGGGFDSGGSSDSGGDSSW